MKYLKYTVVYLIVFFIETNLIDIISVKNITPNLILIFLIFVSLREPQKTPVRESKLAFLLRRFLRGPVDTPKALARDKE